MRELILEVDSTNIIIVDGKVRIEVDELSCIKLMPNGIYKGRNWFKPLFLTNIQDLVLRRFKEIEEINS